MSPPPAAEVPYGTLDLMVLKTLASLGPQHGYGIARRIEQVAEGALALNQGTIYPALLRLEQKGWIASEWGTSENNRRARFYSITAAGRKQLDAEAQLWARTVVDGQPPPGAGVVTRLRVLLARLLGTLTGRRREDELREELETHLELLADEHRRRGLSDAEARLAARRELGGVAQTREAFRDTRVLPGIDALRQDVRFAVARADARPRHDDRGDRAAHHRRQQHRGARRRAQSAAAPPADSRRRPGAGPPAL